MEILIVNFSDAHFKDVSDSLVDKKDKIIQAIKSRNTNNSELLFIMSGDIAFSGRESEYEVALEFFESITSEFTDADFICVPGNHDCDFSQIDSRTRRVLIQDIVNNNEVEDSTLKNIVVQNNFDVFFSVFKDEWKSISTVQNSILFKTVDYKVSNGNKIRINLINTAWDSFIDEKPGTMIMPMSSFEDLAFSDESVINISVFHHPLHWLEPNNKREFENKLESISDLIITGHEHARNDFIKKTKEGEIFILEGSVLQENANKSSSEFNLIKIRFEEFGITNIYVEKFMWNDLQKKYMSVESVKENIDTLKRKRIKISEGTSDLFLFSESHNEFIEDLGANIKHPRVDRLKIDDIYVFPDFEEAIEEKKETIAGDNLIKSIHDKLGIWFIEGDSESGKTTLLKKYIKESNSKGLVSVYIDAEIIKNIGYVRKFESARLKKYIKNQYQEQLFERFRQLDKNKKIVFIDNWELIAMNTSGKKELLKALYSNFGAVVITANSSGEGLSEIVSLESEVSSKINYLQMKRFGYKRREELVEKWITIGNEYTFGEADIINLTKEYTSQVNQVIGKSYVPKAPIYILVILQSIDNKNNLVEFNRQSNGYFYEIIIKQQLMNIGIGSNEIATLQNYLNHLAFTVYVNENKSLSHSEWEKFHQVYLDQYELGSTVLDFSKYKANLMDSKIFKKYPDDRFSFTYNYAFYFFTAQYLAENISQDTIKKQIKGLIEGIDVGVNSNVLMFLTHLSKDEFILESVVNYANSLLLDEAELIMEQDINELNELITELPSLVFEKSSTRENRKQYNEIRDSNNENEDHFIQVNDSSKEAEEEDESLYVKSGYAIEADKANELSAVIGQILKNYSGSIIKDVKYNLLDSAYGLSLRTGTRVINSLKNERESLISFITERISEKVDNIKEVGRAEIELSAKKFVFYFVEIICYAIISKSVFDTGTQSLQLTYENLMQDEMSVARKLIVSGSYLENTRHNPSTGDTKKLYDELKNNNLARGVLRQFILKDLFLTERPYNEIQQISRVFNFEYSNVLLAKEKQKKLNNKK